jgi:hypothetical protein
VVYRSERPFRVTELLLSLPSRQFDSVALLNDSRFVDFYFGCEGSLMWKAVRSGAARRWIA